MATIEHGNHGSGTQNNNTGSGNQYITNNYDVKAKADRFLADLRDGITDPRDDKLRIEDTKGGLLRESYYWIFENEDFNRWKNDQACRLLWIRGDPGKGKTMLVCGIIHELKEAGEEPIFFFCQASDSNLSKAESVLRGLLYVLLDQRKNLVEPFLQKHDHVGKQMFEDKNGWVVLRDMITAAIHQKSDKRLCLIVDALDECTSGLSKLLEVVVKLSTMVRIIVTSRNRPSIEIGMATNRKKVQIVLELNEYEISVAVDKYIRHKVENLAVAKLYDDSLRKEVQAHLTSNSNQTFLWVSLVCQQLADIEVAKRHTRKKLLEFPPGLESVYDQILSHVLGSPDAESCQSVLVATSAAYRPLSLSELGALLDIDSTDDLMGIVADCNSLLTVRQEIVYFVHQSAKDYLLHRSFEEVMPSGKGHKHRIMVSKSLKAMSLHLRTNMFGLESSGMLFQPRDELEPAGSPLKAVGYSCQYWLNHLDEEEEAGYEQLSEACEFLSKHFLNWIEALCLLQRVGQGVFLMGSIADRSSTSRVPRFESFATDAERFLRRFRPALDHNPLQVYSSLLFTPSRSIITYLFQDQKPDWIVSKPVVDEEWTPCVDIIELHTAAVTCLAFSSDCLWLASGALEDEYVYIWDVFLGGLDKSLKFDSSPTSLAFSPDSSSLAIASIDGSLVVWNIETDETIIIFEARDGLCASTFVSFSEDGKLILLASDKHIQVLNSQTGRCLHTLKHGCSGSITVTFLSGGDGVTCVSNDGTSILWQIPSNTCLERTVEATDSKRRAFCANGSQIVTVAGSFATYWDTITCKRLRKVRSPFFEGSSSVVFSKDGKIIACLKGSCPVILLSCYDHSDDCQFLGTLAGGFHAEKLEFGAGSFLAIVGDDSCVELWDILQLRILGLQALLPATSHQDIVSAHAIPMSLSTNLGERPNGNIDISELGSSIPSELNRSIPGVLAVAFSTDGTQFVSMTFHSLNIWDAHTGLHLQTLGVIPTHEQHTHYALYLDGDQILVAARSCDIIEIWNVKDGILQHQWEMLGSLTDTHGAMVFSPNATLLATSLEDGLVCIWEVATGVLKASVNVPCDITHLEFMEVYSTLRTDVEDIFLDISSTPFTVWTQGISHPRTYGYYYERNGAWITKKSENQLWLPPEYRTEIFAIKGSAIALGCKSGRTALLRFK